MGIPLSPSPDATEGTAPRRPRWIPLSLRIFVAILIALVVGGALRVGIRAYRQRVVIAEVERLHGWITRVPCTPEWLKPWLGASCDMLFNDITRVWLSEKPATDDSLHRLKGLTNLQELWV